MSLSIALRVERPGFVLDFVLATEARAVALHGPSGAGKTTILNAVAGLLRPSRGRIVIDGAVLTDTAAGIHLPPQKRRVGYVFQDARLFPHLSVRRNLLYGTRFAPREPGGPSLEAVCDCLGIGHLLDRRPATLSGGEAQRVAMGRAWLMRPRILLMDEPLAALDEARKRETLPFIVRMRDEMGLPILYVSHQLDEARQVAAEIAPVGRA